MARWLSRWILRLGFGLTVAGEWNIPRRGPIIVAPNHRSDIDPVVVAAAIPRRCTFLAAAELLTRPALGKLMRLFPVLPIKRGGFDRRAIKDCLTCLARGDALVIFPEGNISADGSPQPAQNGVAFMAAHAHAAIIPVGIAGTHEVWPSGTTWPRRGRIAVRIGEPIAPSEAPSRHEQSALTGRVMEAIARLTHEAAAGRHPAIRRQTLPSQRIRRLRLPHDPRVSEDLGLRVARGVARALSLRERVAHCARRQTGSILR